MMAYSIDFKRRCVEPEVKYIGTVVPANKMNSPSINIQHGTLLNVTGRPVRTANITFLSANVWLAGDDSSSSHPLSDYLPHSTSEARSLIRPNQDAPWTLGRILNLFGYHLLADINEFRSEISLFSQSFMAVLHVRDNLAIPFYCTDCFCESALVFSSEESFLSETKDLIAMDFWSLLLSEPSSIEDYECNMLHSKIGSGRIRFGVRGGDPFLIDTQK